MLRPTIDAANRFTSLVSRHLGIGLCLCLMGLACLVLAKHVDPSGPPGDLMGGGVPAAPANLTATAQNTAVQLVWNPSSGATGYNIYR